MSSNLPYKQAANVERRTWDKDKYEARAKARIEAETQDESTTLLGHKRSLTETLINSNNDDNNVDDNEETDTQKEEFQPADKNRAGPMHSKRAFLKARKSKVDLESKVGTSEIVNPEEAAKPSSLSTGTQITNGISKVGGGVGWYCKVCDCYLKDSLTYLDHINGRKHQRALGYSMRIEKSTTEEVTSKLQELIEAKRKKDVEVEKEIMLLNGKDEDDDDGMNEFEKLVKKKDEDMLKRKEERKKRREERKKKAREEKESTSNSITNTCDNNTESRDNQDGNAEEGEEIEENIGIDPEIAKMMGFSSFG